MTEFKVQASYQGEGEYTLAVDGEDHTRVKASGKIHCEGLDNEGTGSLTLRGAIGDHQVSADVATVEGAIHIFTRVSHMILHPPVLNSTYKSLGTELLSGHSPYLVCTCFEPLNKGHIHCKD